jgi:hypothetical protein
VDEVRQQGDQRARGRVVEADRAAHCRTCATSGCRTRHCSAPLVEAGLPADLTELHLATDAAFNRGAIRPHTGRTADTTTPTTFAEFVGSLGIPA